MYKHFLYEFEDGKRIRLVTFNKNEFFPRPRFQVKKIAEKTYGVFWSNGTHITCPSTICHSFEIPLIMKFKLGPPGKAGLIL